MTNTNTKEKQREAYLRWKEKDADRYKKKIEKNRGNYHKKKEDYKEKGKVWKQNNRDKRNEQTRRYAKKYPEKINAHNKAHCNIKIPLNQLCEECNKNLAEERHHPDYDKPLEVKFVCIECHTKIHNKKKGDC